MLITAKFASYCPRCHDRIAPGTRVLWERGEKATHVDCQPRPAPAPRPEARVDGSRIVAFLRGAQDRGLKYPKVRFLAPGGGELRLSLAGLGSRYPGSLQVKKDHDWIGRIEPTGRCTAGLMGLVETLDRIAQDPARAAREYAALSGHCSFCNLPLTDEGSVEVGYGPICAQRFGLPHTSRGSKRLHDPLDGPMTDEELALEAAAETGRYRGGYRTFRDGSYREDFGADR